MAIHGGMGEGVLEGRGLTRTYTSGEVQVQALRGVDVSFEQGEFAVLLGPSGSGKSTLLNILGGLDTPSSGTVRYRDHLLSGASDAELTRYRREHVGFVFQFYNLVPSLTALENVALVADISDHPMPPGEALERVGLSDRADHFPSQLSGGEQQRVALARALVKRPELLLCDEPTGALDAATGQRVLEALARAHGELGTTVVIITHNQAISLMANRVLTFSDGRVVGEQRNPFPRPPSDIRW